MEKDFSFLQHLQEVESSQQIYQEIGAEKLWLLRWGDEIKGPYVEEDLVKIIPHNRPAFAQIVACNAKDKQWLPFFDHYCFDLRKQSQTSRAKLLELVPESQEYYYLFNGQKRGPFNTLQMKELFESKELRNDFLISCDQGKTWQRAFSYPQFERRKSKDPLPMEQSMESAEELFETTAILSRQKLTSQHKNDDALSMESSLLISRQNFKDLKQSSEPLATIDKLADETRHASYPIISLKVVYSLLASAVLLLVFYFVPQKSSPLRLHSRSPSNVSESTAPLQNKFEDLPPAPVQKAERPEPIKSYDHRRNNAPEEETAYDREDEQNDEYIDRPTKSKNRKKRIKRIDLSENPNDRELATDENNMEEQPIDEPDDNNSFDPAPEDLEE